MCPGVELEGWLRWFAHPCVVLSAGGLAQYSPFAPGSSEAEGGLYVFVSFWSRICLNLTCAVIFVPYSFFVSFISRRGVFKCQIFDTEAKGSRS